MALRMARDHSLTASLGETRTVRFKGATLTLSTNDEGITTASFLGALQPDGTRGGYPDGWPIFTDLSKLDTIKEEHFYDEDAPEPTEEDLDDIFGPDTSDSSDDAGADDGVPLGNAEEIQKWLDDPIRQTPEWKDLMRRLAEGERPEDILNL